MIAIIHSLWMSKLRYGLQLCTTVQIALTETRTAAMKSLQKAQNRMLRLINKTKIKDKISTHSMLDRFNLLSVNQLAAQIKLIEVWKSINIENYPIQMEPYNIHFGESGHSLRERNNQVFRETSRLQYRRGQTVERDPWWDQSIYNENRSKAPNLGFCQDPTSLNTMLQQTESRGFKEAIPVPER